MKINKIKITIAFGILILSVIAVLLIRISSKEPKLKSERTSAPAKSNTPSEIAFKPLLVKELERLNIPVLPIPKPDLKTIYNKKSLPSSTVSFFENVNKAAKAAEKSLIPDSIPVQKVSTVTPNGIILSLTEDQFHFLYPDSFIAGLVDVQNLFIKELDANYQPILKIKTDAQVRFIEEKIVASLLSSNMINKEKAEQFITTIRFTLPELQLIDLKKYYSKNLFESSNISKFLNSASGIKIKSDRAASRGLLLSAFSEKLMRALSQKVQAACGSCSSRPECFQEGASTSGKAGSELFYPSCYCTGCLTSLGCLSANNSQAAIYDQSTGICGVGL